MSNLEQPNAYARVDEQTRRFVEVEHDLQVQLERGIEGEQAILNSIVMGEPEPWVKGTSGFRNIATDRRTDGGKKKKSTRACMYLARLVISTPESSDELLEAAANVIKALVADKK